MVIIEDDLVLMEEDLVIMDDYLVVMKDNMEIIIIYFQTHKNGSLVNTNTGTGCLTKLIMEK